ncbi:hypothetical protein [Salmonella enterica]|uniref:hypothetical protein n=1 Tax=Salmonella enterica TaxID=28901 RepID=UPI003CE6B449
MGRWWRYKWITFHPSLTIENDDDSLRRLDKEFYNIIKRGCKAGIMSTLLDDSKHHIHFSLDGIDMDGVVTKTRSNPGAGMPAYTGVELRCAYRLRDQLKDKLHFYENGLEVLDVNYLGRYASTTLAAFELFLS